MFVCVVSGRLDVLGRGGRLNGATAVGCNDENRCIRSLRVIRYCSLQVTPITTTTTTTNNNNNNTTTITTTTNTITTTITTKTTNKLLPLLLIIILIDQILGYYVQRRIKNKWLVNLVTNKQYPFC